MWAELRYPWTDFLEKITRDPKMGLVYLALVFKSPSNIRSIENHVTTGWTNQRSFSWGHWVIYLTGRTKMRIMNFGPATVQSIESDQTVVFSFQTFDWRKRSRRADFALGWRKRRAGRQRKNPVRNVVLSLTGRDIIRRLDLYPWTSLLNNFFFF